VAVRPSRSSELAQSVVALITDQDLPPGAPLPTEARLTEELATSRGPLREALKALQALGIVEVRHGYGTFVGPASADAILPWLAFRARTRSALADLLDVREMLECGLISRLARTGASPDLVTALRAEVAVMGRGGTAAGRADQRFHEILCEAAGNELARDLVRIFWRAYADAETEIGTRTSDPAALAARHAAIVDAVEARSEAEVGSAVAHHFDEVRRRLG
jgi:DNA-binding FadR family transcriptional regulator